MTLCITLPSLPWWAWAALVYGAIGCGAAVWTRRLRAVALWPLVLLVLAFGVVQ